MYNVRQTQYLFWASLYQIVSNELIKNAVRFAYDASPSRCDKVNVDYDILKGISVEHKLACQLRLLV